MSCCVSSPGLSQDPLLLITEVLPVWKVYILMLTHRIKGKRLDREWVGTSFFQFISIHGVMLSLMLLVQKWTQSIGFLTSQSLDFTHVRLILTNHQSCNL